MTQFQLSVAGGNLGLSRLTLKPFVARPTLIELLNMASLIKKISIFIHLSLHVFICIYEACWTVLRILLLCQMFDFLGIYTSLQHIQQVAGIPGGCVHELVDKETLSLHPESDEGQYLLVLMTGVGSTHVSLHPNVAKDWRRGT